MAPKASIDSAVEKFVNSRIAYVNCIGKTPGGNVKGPSEQTLAAIAKQLVNITSIQPDIATQLITTINDSKLDEEIKPRVVDLIQTKVQLFEGEATDAEQGDGKQEHDFLPEYIQKDNQLAELFLPCDSPDVFARLRGAAKLLRKIGCNHPTERCKANAASLAFPEATDLDMFQLADDAGYRYLLKFREYFYKSPVLTSGQLPSLYPPFDQFQMLQPTLYFNAGFAGDVNQPLFTKEVRDKLKAIGLAMPLRSTNGMVANEPAPSRHGRAPRRTANIQRSLSGFCSEMTNLQGFRITDPRTNVQYDLPQLALPPLFDRTPPPPPSRESLTPSGAPNSDAPANKIEPSASVAEPKIAGGAEPQPALPVADKDDEPPELLPVKPKSVSEMVAAMQETRPKKKRVLQRRQSHQRQRLQKVSLLRKRL